MIELPNAPANTVSRARPGRAGAADDRRKGLMDDVDRFRVCVCPDA